jgi:hypothetical protein
MTQWINLDQLAAIYSQKIVENQEKQKSEIENLVTKSLGVLQENGVYAMTLYLLSRSSEKEKKLAEGILKKLIDLFTDEKLKSLKLEGDAKKIINLQKPMETLQFFSNKVCDDLDTLLLVRSLYEQVLIYARYGAKALEKKDSTGGSTP